MDREQERREQFAALAREHGSVLYSLHVNSASEGYTDS